MSTKKSFAAVIGAPAAGKTHVAKAWEREILAESAAEMRENLQYLPVVYYRTPINLLTREPTFNWTRFSEGLLSAARHPNSTLEDIA